MKPLSKVGLLFFVLMGCSILQSWAEMPPSYYQKLQENAPEHLNLKIQDVHVDKRTEGDWERAKISVSALVLEVLKSESELKPGEVIRIRYETVLEFPAGWTGPGSPMLLKSGQEVGAWLRRTGISEFTAEARGASFRIAEKGEAQVRHSSHPLRKPFSATVVWSSWCPATFRQSKEIAAILKPLQEEGLIVTSVSYDKNREDLEAAVINTGESMTGWQHLLASEGSGQALIEKWKIDGLPAVVLLDSDGELLGIWSSSESLAAALQEGNHREAVD